jgi:hypothetical protein
LTFPPFDADNKTVCGCTPHSYTRREIRLLSTIGFFVGAEIEMARLEEKSSQLSEELEARKVVERAKGILQRELRVSEEEAYLTLRSQSRQMRKTMREVGGVHYPGRNQPQSEEISRLVIRKSLGHFLSLVIPPTY